MRAETPRSCSACFNSSSPECVSVTLRLSRSNSLTPKSLSSVAMRAEMAVCVVCSFSDAARKLRSLATHTKVSMKRKFIGSSACSPRAATAGGIGSDATARRSSLAHPPVTLHTRRVFLTPSAYTDVRVHTKLTLSTHKRSRRPFMASVADGHRYWLQEDFIVGSVNNVSFNSVHTSRQTRRVQRVLPTTVHLGNSRESSRNVRSRTTERGGPDWC